MVYFASYIVLLTWVIFHIKIIGLKQKLNFRRNYTMFRTEKERELTYNWEEKVPYSLKEQFIDLGYSIKDVNLCQVIGLAKLNLDRYSKHINGLEHDETVALLLEVEPKTLEIIIRESETFLLYYCELPKVS